MVEVFAVASGKGGTGKTTSTVALGMALSERYDVTVVDADTGMANLLFHAGLSDAETTLHDVLADTAPVAEAAYDRFGMTVVPCGTSLDGFRDADPTRLREVVATLAADTDVMLLDSPPALDSRAAVLPIVMADRAVVVLQPTIPAISDGLKVQEYAAYGTDVAGILFNKVREDGIEAVAEKTERYFDGPTLGAVPESERAREARRAGRPLLAHAPDCEAARVYREAAASLSVRHGNSDDVADRFGLLFPSTPNPLPALDGNDLTYRRVPTHAPLSRSDAHTTRIGTAARAPLPGSHLGPTMDIEAAWTLADALAYGPPRVEDALDAYERRRHRRAARLWEHGHERAEPGPGRQLSPPLQYLWLARRIAFGHVLHGEQSTLAHDVPESL